MIHSHRNLCGQILLGAVLLAVLLMPFDIDQAQTRSPLPFPAGAPKAVIKNVLPADPSVSSGATISRAGLSAPVTPGFLLYVGDVIETQSVKVTVEFLDEPYAARQNEVIIDVNSRVGISSTYSWWGTVWAKVKGAFESKTTYAQAGATGTEYEFTVHNPTFSLTDPVSATLVVLEGTVDVDKGRNEFISESFERHPLRTIDARESPQLVLASFTPPFDPQEQFARTLDVPPGEITSYEATYHLHNDCKQKHRIEFHTSDNTEWLQLQGPVGVDIEGGQNVPVTLKLLIDATRLAAGRHESHIIAACVDCKREAKCPAQQLDYPLSVNVTGAAQATNSPTPPPSISPTPFSVHALQQAMVTRNPDRAAPAPAARIESVLSWTNQVLVNTQPTYSAQNLIPHFASVDERSQNFVAARARAVLTNAPGSHTTLGNVYSDWGRAAWAVYAYDKDLNRSGAPPDLSIDRGEALRLTGKLDEAAGLNLASAVANSVKAQNLLGNIALDRARIALDQGNMQEVDAKVEEAKSHYALAQGTPQGTQLMSVQRNSTIQANTAEASIVAGEAALRNNSPQDAQTKFDEATRALEANQQSPSIYPFPITDLGVAYRGLGDAAALSGDLKAGQDWYARARQKHEQAIAGHHDFAEAYFNLGDLYDDLGDYENAKKYYRLAIQARPEQPAAYLPLAVLLQSEDPQLAAALAATFLELERQVFLQGQKAATAQQLVNHSTVARPARLGEKIKAGPTGNTQNTGTGDKITVPPLKGKPISQARSDLEGLGLRVTEETKIDRKQPADTVIDQDPKPPKQVKRGSTVKLVVSLGDLVEVPDVTGKDEVDARKKITADNKLTVGRVEGQPDCRLVGKVLTQNPVHSKTLVPRGTLINLVVGSVGDNPVDIPTFADRSSAEAFIRKNGLTLGRISQEETDDYPAGKVLRQSPSAGKQYGRNCPVKVDLLIATPIVWVFTDNYVGLTEQQARQQLRSIDLYAQVTYQESPNDPPGNVLHQFPPPQTKVKHRSYVSLVVAVSPKVVLVPVPSVCGLTKGEARAKLKQLGFVNDDNDVSYEAPPKLITCGKGMEGTVFMQDPMPNAKVPPGTRVKLKLVNSNIGED